MDVAQKSVSESACKRHRLCPVVQQYCGLPSCLFFFPKGLLFKVTFVYVFDLFFYENTSKGILQQEVREEMDY